MIYRLIFSDNGTYQLAEVDENVLALAVKCLVSLKDKKIISISLIGEEDE